MAKMTKAQALKEARRRWGPRAFVRDLGEWLRDGSKRPSSNAERAEAKAELLALRAARPTMKPLEEWPPDAPVGEYREALRAHQAAFREWREREQWLSGLQHCYRFEAGVQEAIGNWIKAEGDNWGDVFARADERDARDAERAKAAAQ